MLLLGEIVEQLNTKETTVQALADKYSKNRKRIGERLATLGYVREGNKYVYAGSPDKQQEIEQLSFDSVVDLSYDRSLDKAVEKVSGSSKGIDESRDSSVSSQKGTGEALAVDSNKTTRETLEGLQEATEGSDDIIGVLLQGKQDKGKKVYRGIYLDKAVDDIVSGAANKSELINQILIKEFKARGLM